MARLTEKIFPTLNNGTYSIYNVNQNISKNEESTTEDSTKKKKNYLILSLKPGEKYKGKFVIKNHDKPFNFIITDDKFTKVDAKNEAEKDQPERLPILNYPKTSIYLNKGEFKFINYEVTVPLETPEGNYFATLQTYPPDRFKNQDKKANIHYIFTAGMEIALEVTNNPKNYTFEDQLSDPKTSAWKRVLYDLRFIAAIFFALLALGFMAISFKKNNF